MTHTDLTDEQKITLLKHLANGKTLDWVAAAMTMDRGTVLDVASRHGFPDTDKLAWAADLLSKKTQENRTVAVPEARTSTPATPRPSAAAPVVTPIPRPDDLRVLLNTAKSHPAKRIQAAADRIFDQVDKLNALIAEDETKHAEQRRAAAEKAAARAEVEALEQQLADAKAKLRGSATIAPSSGTGDAAVVRAWAAEHSVTCPTRGRIPKHVREAYDERNAEAAS